MIKATNSEGMVVTGDTKTSASSTQSSARKSLSERSSSIQAEKDKRIKKIPKNCINSPTGIIKKSRTERGEYTVSQSYPPFTLSGSPLPPTIQGISGINIRSRKTGVTIPVNTTTDQNERAYLAESNYEDNILPSTTIITQFNSTTLRFKNDTYNLQFISINTPLWGTIGDTADNIMKSNPEINLLFDSYDDGGNRNFFHISIPIKQYAQESHKNPFLTSWFNKTPVSPSGLTLNDLLNFRGGHENQVEFNLMELCLDYNLSGKEGVKEKYKREKITSAYNLCVFETPLYADLSKITNNLSREPMPINVGDKVKLVSTYKNTTGRKRCLEDGSDKTGGEVFWANKFYDSVQVCSSDNNLWYNKGTEVINVLDTEQPILKIDKNILLKFDYVFNAILNIPHYTATIPKIIDNNLISFEEHFGSSSDTQDNINPAFYTVNTSLLSGTQYTSQQLKEGTRGLQNVKCYPIDLANQIDDAGNIYIDETNNNPEDPKSVLRDSIYSGKQDAEYDVTVDSSIKKRQRNIAIFIILTVLLAIIVFVIAGYIASNVLKPSDLKAPSLPTAAAAVAAAGAAAVGASGLAAVGVVGANAIAGNKQIAQESISPTNATTVGIIAALASSSPP